MAKVSALLDSGATENFIDRQTVSTIGLGIRALPEPLNIHNVDGTTNSEGQITKYANLWVRQGKQIAKLRFYITNLGRDCLILGHPWFRQFNPHIDWTRNVLRGEDVCLETARYQSKKRLQAGKTQVTPTTIDPTIPKYYHRHAIVFDEKAAQRFPPSREEDHPITLKPDAPPSIDCKVYAQTKDKAEATKEFIEDHLKKGYIVESNSPYALPFFYRTKKDGKLRPIMDYRVLNSLTVRDTYPLLLINTILEQLQGKELFTKFDIRWGYNNICIKEEDQWKAAFKTPLGLFQPRVMFFGLTNSPATFCRAMARMFRRLVNKYPTELFVYMDDILIAMKNDLLRHRQIVDEVLDLLAKESYFLRPSKCIFEQTRVEYLGLVVDGGKLTIDPTKAEGLRDWPRMLTKVKQVRSVLGVLGYQRPFIPNYATIAKPLTDLTKKDHPFSWRPECRKALDTLINIILSNPSLQQPDPAKPFTLQVDASAFATGAILTQNDDRGKDEAVGYHSQTFSAAERNYDIHDRELLALVRGLSNWRHLLIGSPHPITVYTDHKNLEYYRHPQHINRRVACYIPCLADYNFILVHLPGECNKADALSRRPDLHLGDDDNQEVTVLHPSLFACASTLSTTDDRVRAGQLTSPEDLH